MLMRFDGLFALKKHPKRLFLAKSGTRSEATLLPGCDATLLELIYVFCEAILARVKSQFKMSQKVRSENLGWAKRFFFELLVYCLIYIKTLFYQSCSLYQFYIFFKLEK